MKRPYPPQFHRGYMIRFNIRNSMWEFRAPVITNGELEPKIKEWKCFTTQSEAKGYIDNLKVLAGEDQ